MKLVLSFSRNELSMLGYPVIVERWDKRREGKGRRRWLAEFTEPERNLLARYCTLFYKWYLVSGAPEEFTFRRLTTIELIRKASAFFASI